jgi:hypothetical protein
LKSELKEKPGPNRKTRVTLLWRRQEAGPALTAARSKHSARLQRKLKALGSYLSASRASDVIDIEGCCAGVRLWFVAINRGAAKILVANEGA